MAATPPTPPVLQVAPLGANGPGRDPQSPGEGGEVHCAPVILHVPSVGHSAGSLPLTVQVLLVWMLQVPVTLVHVELARHDKPDGLLHVPGVGWQPAADVHDVAAGVTHVPFTVGHVAAEVQAAKGELLHVPGVGRHAAADVHEVTGDVGYAQVPFWDGQSVFSVQAAPPTVQ